MTLATVQTIKEIKPIENADRIEVAKVLGWEVVVKKNEFKVGDLCIYVEIDTLIPNKDWSKFLFTGSHVDDEYHRLRTIKLRGQVSQGLVLLINTINSNTLLKMINERKDFFCAEGLDVTEYLGIKKYESPEINIGSRSNRIKARSFPSFIRKTDEVRIQSNLELLEQLKHKPYYITQKLDGTSFTCYKYNNKFGVCSRNMELLNPKQPKGFIQFIKREIRKLLGKTKKEVPATNTYWRMAEKYNIESWLPDGFAIQGEIVGPGIQRNKLGLDELRLFIFNVWYIKEQRHLYFRELDFFTDIIEYVPEILDGDSFNYTFEELMTIAENQTYPNGSSAEGIVVRNLDQTISFKVVSNKFLLEYGE